MIRGDIEVNETKLRNLLKVSELRFATDDQIHAIGAVPGFASPMNLDITRVQIVFDRSARETSNLVVGETRVGVQRCRSDRRTLSVYRFFKNRNQVRFLNRVTCADQFAD